jgi:hypothetical protein
MPTNVTPEFKRAKEAFQKAREPAERLQCLKDMLRTVPKHKGTEHLQADIKSRIKEITEELAGPKKGGARTGPSHTVRPDGAAQVALVGPPNSGKSSLHAALTGSHADVGPYPYSTQEPLPGMLLHEDVHIQLVDLPAIDAQSMVPWMPNALQQANAALLVVDLNLPGCVENVAAIREKLDEKRVSLVHTWPGRLEPSLLVAEPGEPPPRADEDDEDDPFHVYLPTLLVANKSDVGADADEIEALEDLLGVRFPAVTVSTETGEGLDRIGRLLFEGLNVIRVYTKTPGRPADDDKPYTLFRGDTVEDVARLVHRDIAASLKFARIWGSAKFDGQQVGKDHVVNDGDVVELHT